MLWCLHGFLGEGADWDPFEPAFADLGIAMAPRPEFFKGPLPALTLAEWGERFAKKVAQEDDAPIVMGYSMGGRLALHALLANPALWRGAVIIGAHPGFADPKARAERQAGDEKWAKRFENDPWNEVVAAWDAQPLFGGLLRETIDPKRFDRGALAAAMRQWTTGKQEYLLPRLETITCPVLWVVGEHDERARGSAEAAVAKLPRGELWVVSGASHRVPWERPREFVERAKAFMKGLEE